MRDNATAWWYYLELALPFLSLVTIALSADAFRPGWPHARVKLAIVAVLAVVLNAGFLRSPLGARELLGNLDRKRQFDGLGQKRDRRNYRDSEEVCPPLNIPQNCWSLPPIGKSSKNFIT